MEVFADRGYRGATLSEVAERAGVTKALVYKHFASKAELYVLLLEQQASELMEVVAASVRPSAAPEERLRAGVDAFLAAVERRPFARKLLFRDPEADAEVAAAYDRVHARATVALARGLAADEEMLRGDPHREQALELLAQVLKAGLNGLAAWWLAHPEVTRDALLERAMQLLWPGLRELSGEWEEL